MSSNLGVLKSAVESNQSIAVLLDAYSQIKKSKTIRREDTRLLAETCFLLAKAYKSKHDKKAQTFGKEAVALFKSLHIRSQRDALPFLKCLNVDYVHEGVVEAEIFGEEK